MGLAPVERLLAGFLRRLRIDIDAERVAVLGDVAGYTDRERAMRASNGRRQQEKCKACRQPAPR
jgi:hypothetical protein